MDKSLIHESLLFPRVNKHTFVLLLIIFTLLVSNVFFVYKIISKVEDKESSVSSMTVATSTESKETTLAPALANKVYDLLLIPDQERGNDEICGYKSGELADQLILSKQQTANTKYESGVWSNDCKTYVYGVGIHIPVTSFTKEVIGIWVYYPEENKNVMLLPTYEIDVDYPQVYTFVSKNLVSAAGRIINIQDKKVVDLVDEKTNWILYRDSFSPWMFMTPADWVVNYDESEFASSDQDNAGLFYKSLVFDTSNGVKITFFTDEHEYDFSSYSDNHVNYLKKYGYAHYYNNDHKPQVIYILKDGGNYPKVISLEGKKNSTVTEINNMFSDVIETFEEFK